ncbi:MAG: hypothetical protein KI790_15240 [Cyclobacteriaceae bacterium]|nr:hypothetical protein [Cyclobacteriaceae bacterium HetDA_MAG_MS6]
MNPQIPTYISFAFLLAIGIPIYLIASLAQKHTPSKHPRALFYGIVGFYLVYLLAVALACVNDAFIENTLPPKIIQWTTLPLLLFLMAVVFNTGFFKRLLKEIPVDQLILLHRFRLIGSFFIILLLLKLLPSLFALIAGIGDVVTALSSFWVAKMIRNRRENGIKLAVLWNSFGLLDILLTSTMALVFTKISIETGVLGVEVLATFPFCFIPAFAPATIIFLHMSIYRKLLAKRFR